MFNTLEDVPRDWTCKHAGRALSVWAGTVNGRQVLLREFASQLDIDQQWSVLVETCPEAIPDGAIICSDPYSTTDSRCALTWRNGGRDTAIAADQAEAESLTGDLW